MALVLEIGPGQEISVGDAVSIRLEHKTGSKARLIFEADKSVPITLNKTRHQKSDASWRPGGAKPSTE